MQQYKEQEDAWFQWPHVGLAWTLFDAARVSSNTENIWKKIQRTAGSMLMSFVPKNIKASSVSISLRAISLLNISSPSSECERDPPLHPRPPGPPFPPPTSAWSTQTSWVISTHCARRLDSNLICIPGLEDFQPTQSSTVTSSPNTLVCATGYINQGLAFVNAPFNLFSNDQ